MKRIQFLSIILLLLFIPSYGQTTGGSSITTCTHIGPSNSNTISEIVYDNGLGDVIQQTKIGITPNGAGLSVHYEYDRHGRKTRAYLPIVSYSGSSYISAYNIASNAVSMYGASNPYEDIGYDEIMYRSPSFISKPGNTVASHVEYGEHTGVGMSSFMDGAVFLSRRTKYLYTQTTDEDNCTTTEYTDLNGVRLITETSAGRTYYTYTPRGDISHIIPPELSRYIEENSSLSILSDNDEMMQKYAYIYKYDGLGHCIYKKLPGCSPIYYIYDKAGNCIFTQDGNLRTHGEWSYTIPDKFGRPCISGICHNSLSYTQQPLHSVHVHAEYNGTSEDYKGYCIHNISLTSPILLTATYYDSYEYVGQCGVPVSLTSAGSLSGSFDTSIHKGLPTGNIKAYTDVNGVVGYTYSALYYDNNYHVARTVAINHRGGLDITDTEYTYTDKPLQIRITHSSAGGAGAAGISLTETYTYTYDHADRLTDITHKIGNRPAVTLAHNEYDELCNLSSTRRMGPNGLTTLFTYDNLDSTLREINTTGLFVESLYYGESHNGNTPCHNGNISAMEWKAGNMNLSRGYNFSYDNTSRLVNASYRENGGSSNKYSVEYEYNSMGSITSLRRNGLQDGGTYGRIDNLTMTYDGNRLVKVSDSVTDPTYNGAWNFADHANADIEYEYDENGNVTKDLNRKILSIQYNSLNLPSLITFNDMSTTSYTYSADGTKLRAVYHTNLLDEEVEEDGVAEEADGEEEEVIEEYDYEDEEEVSVDCFATKTIDYVGNCIYEDGVLKQMLVDGGFVTYPNGNATGSPTYHFYLQDHLGNNRVVVNESGSVEQVNHYYPYGGLMAESTGGDMQRYKYNGKELDRMHGLDWHDYGARWNDNSVGTWTTMDPKCEDYPDVSPYVYCMGNPVRFLDSDGRKPGDFFKSIRNAAIDFGLYYNDNSIRENREYACFAFEVTNEKGEKGYSYSIARLGTSISSIPISEYGNVNNVATFHTHAAYDKDYGMGNNIFSGLYDSNGYSVADKRSINNPNTDIGNANLRGIPSYVATPNGSLQEYNPETGKVTVISNCMPSDSRDPGRLNNVGTDERDSSNLVELLDIQFKINQMIINNFVKR